MENNELLVKLRIILADRDQSSQRTVTNPEILEEFSETLISSGYHFDLSCVELKFCFMDTKQFFFNSTPSGGLELKDLNSLTVALTNFFGKQNQKPAEYFWHVEKILSCLDPETRTLPPSERQIGLFLDWTQKNPSRTEFKKTLIEKQVFELTCLDKWQAGFKRFLPANFSLNELTSLLISNGDFPTSIKKARTLYKAKDLKHVKKLGHFSKEER